MSGITFTTRGHEEGTNRVRESSANLPGRVHLSMTACRGTRLIGLGLSHDFMAVQLEFSPDQAQAIAAELLACADTLNIAKAGAAHAPVVRPATGRA